VPITARQVIFRVDSSRIIGNGHVMRCTNFAKFLRNRGVDCRFISRTHDGALRDIVVESGFEQLWLAKPPASEVADMSDYSQWLGVPVSEDAEETIAVLQGSRADFLVVDHYSLDWRWESRLYGHARAIFVVDDLANRRHFCDVLLDQTVNRDKCDYDQLVPDSCKVLTGVEFALIDPSFSRLRKFSLSRRSTGGVKRLLISLGGVDPNNITLKVLEILETISRVRILTIDVVVAKNCPNLASLKTFCSSTKLKVSLIIGTSEMAEIMARSDIAIGAGGTSSWERCVLGLPTVQLTLAGNQDLVVSSLHKLGAAISTDLDHLEQSILKLFNNETRLKVSSRAAAVVDGNGLERIYRELTGGV